ncbi:cytochrome P450 [Pseudoduganella sp. SL102]|uniref:cytochrome P450 n=1 Tax=Pseudoduganella sp. SL102 TaxID=2995154 RepID=UPI00248BE154|nr:cytochrome P450 [Pseudoduganella sp. SL102]WBS03955.1 cytochrome P450 [Pseudoduganella sp. SL102]
MEPDHPPADAVAAVTHPDPYSYYALLAADPAPRYDERLRLWVAAHPATVRQLLADPACRVRPVQEPVPVALAGPAGDLFGALVRMNDGPRHATPKAVLLHALAALPQSLAADHAASVATAMAAEVCDAATLNAFVQGVPVRAVASLLGFADGELPRVAALVARYVACLTPLACPGEIAAGHEAAQALLEALRQLVRRAPGTALLAGVTREPWPDKHALLANLAGLMTQTHDATTGLLGNSIVARLRGDASGPAALVPAVMERDPAIHNTRRFTAAGLDVAGVRVPAGQALLLVLAGTAGFGDGRHACPGQALARSIVTQALRALRAAGPLPRAAWRYRPSVNARMPVFVGEGGA